MKSELLIFIHHSAFIILHFMISSYAANLKNFRALVRFVGTCALGLMVDLFTKAWAFRTLAASIDRDSTGHVRVDLFLT